MKKLLPALFALGPLAIAPAGAQTEPPTAQQLQQQYDQTIQNTNNQAQQSMNQEQLGVLQDQQRRDQLFATQPPLFQQPILPPQPIYILPPPVPQPKS